ncbi:S-DNA-T family DNA segregation ATPase FtsK/SpoIIIE [Sedimentibacter acidaminivorans]|uniref:S-DNA-T family DNA segregation ATPase FtsK/SpoIIIE n=1 Tax=Sedimentibacter acidaminivorans TaxID=913099 RepID=A0ABS4GD28_9FIRM|nr:DNA translocase FtsK [Sedimentibacter acidaminivorans]MBP1925305.1 S-DNA-T family DNA segregation ATPase FtsK/SpoIIIE [Sedimentibacter acidaminivorans]
MAKAQNNETKQKSAVKKTAQKRSTSTTKKTSDAKLQLLKKEISGIFIIAFAVFLIFITHKESQTGIIGKTINVFIISLLGKGANVLPYAILLIGVMRLLNIVILDDKNQIIAVFGFFVCYIMYTALMDTRIYTMLVGVVNFKEMITSSIFFGKSNLGGGILGNILTYICVKLLGKNGTIIILGTMIFTFTILITNQSIIGGATKIINCIKKILKTIYNFIFIEFDYDDSDEKLNKKVKKYKNSNKIIENNVDSDENIRVFDYSNNQKLNSEITQLKIDGLKKADIIKDSFGVNDENKVDCPIEQSESEIKKEIPSKDGSKKTVKDNKFVEKEITDDIINIAGNPSENLIKYKLPSPTLLDPTPGHVKGDKEDLRKEAEKLIETLSNFNIQCNILQINKGPTITRYELQPAPGIKVSRITSLTNDLALSLATSEIRIEAPIPGKSAIGIEVPNKVKTSVFLRNLIESKDYKSVNTNIPFALGKDIAGKNIIASIEKMPHLLIAGATGSGKSVCINSLIMSILYRAKPDEVKLILIDPKVVELSIYNGIPHLLIPVVTDPRKASNALNWAVSEMTNRYKLFAQNSVRDILSYNDKMVKDGFDKMPQIVIVIDELADLMAVASSEVEECITRIAQLARACGIHLVIATQRPSVDVITGVIKANIPSRIAFAVSSYIDSRTILDTSGAEKLLGKGDMLYHPMGMAKPIRIQGTFISDDEIKRVVDNIREQQIEIKTQKSNEIIEEIEKTPTPKEKVDEFLEQAVEMVVNEGQASASYIQRKFKVGYSRAARIIDQLEERGIVGGHEGSKPRKVLITKEELEEMKGNQ